MATVWGKILILVFAHFVGRGLSHFGLPIQKTHHLAAFPAWWHTGLEPKIFCSAPAVANRLIKHGEKRYFKPQETVTITCCEEFDLIGSSVVTCGPDGHWVNLPECRHKEPKICSAPVVANRLVKHRERMQYEPLDTVTIICSKGFDLIGSSVVTCGSDGQWINLPECRPEEPMIFCSAPAVANRLVKRRERMQYEPQDTVTITCKEGFDLIGSSVVTCGSDGQWLNLPECRPEDPVIFCSAPAVKDRLVKRRERMQYEPQDTVTITCSKGFDLIGSSVVTCGSDGQWLNLPECLPEVGHFDIRQKDQRIGIPMENATVTTTSSAYKRTHPFHEEGSGAASQH
ncbi:C4b-binding protein-like [Pseudorasbora parva]|uniref:C4b-binding protein-like n=1 Tax=Pseudorasbora parva TaxID=51549 RepID=UPI00351EFCF8